MKSSHLYVALLLATLFTIQAYSVKLAGPQLTLGLPVDNVDHNYFNRLGFKELLQVSVDMQSPTQTIANVLRYYIDGREYFNYAQSLFCEANTEGRKFITLQRFYEITDAQGIHRVDAHRVSEYVRGVFGSLHNDTDDTPIDAYSFTQAVDLLLAESISIATFAYIVQDSRHSRHVTVSAAQIETALVNVFSTYGRLLPQPNCEEIRYLLKQTDADNDGSLNLQEFHIFLSIYLRFYKSGIQNNRYSVSVMKDRVFEYVWNNEDGLGGHTEKSRFLKLAFARFLQMTVYDRTQNQMSHLFFTKFDSDGSGAIDRDEFTHLLEFFRAPTNEVDVLFAAADSDSSGLIDFAEFVVTLTTLLRRLTADFAYNLITFDGGRTTAAEAYDAFRDATNFLNVELMSEETFTETFESINSERNAALDLEDFTRFASEIIGQLRQRVRIQEEAQISAVAGLDVNNATPDQIHLTIEEASEQVSDIIYSDQGFTTEEAALGYVQRETGATEEEITEAVEAQIEGASIEDVVQVAENIATQEVIDAVTTAVLEEAESDDCPTEQAIEEAIEAVLEDGTIDEIVESLENTPSDDLIQEVANAYEEEGGQEEQEAEEEEREEEQSEEQAAIEEDTEALGDLVDEIDVPVEEVHEAFEAELDGASVEDVIEAVEAIATEEVINAVADAVLESECPTEETIQEAIEEVIENGTVEEIIEELEEAEPEDLIETVTETVEEQAAEENADEVVAEIEEESGYTTEELNDAVEEQIGGATVEEVIEAAQEIATEEVIEAVTEAALEEVESTDCPTEQAIEDAIEAAIEDGAVADVIEELENADAEDIIETVTEVIEEGPSYEEPADVAEQLEQETGYDLEAINETVEEQTGGESVEDVIEAAQELAEQEIVDVVTDAVLEEAASEDCPTAETIQETIEEVLESGAVEDIVEEIAEASPEEIIEELTEAAEEHAAEEPSVAVEEQLEEETGYTIEELNETVEEQTGGATVEEVVEAAQEVAAEEVIEAVTEAVLEEAQSDDCPTEETIQETIEEVIEGGVVEEIIEELEEQTPEEIAETLYEATEEAASEESSDEEEAQEDVAEQLEEETGYTIEEINDALEEATGGASVEEVVEAAEELATEQVIEAVAEAVIEQGNAGECVTPETLQEVVEEVIEDGLVDDLIEELEETAPEEIVEAAAEAVEEAQEEERHPESAFIQLSGFKNFLA